MWPKGSNWHCLPLDLLVIPSRYDTKTNQTNKIQEKANPDNDQSKKIFRGIGVSGTIRKE
jgi:hypothetical protein